MSVVIWLALCLISMLCLAWLSRRGVAARTAAHTLHLICIGGPAAGAVARLDSGGALCIGRGEDCAIRLADPAVSRQHAWLTPAQDGVCIRDACSANGVWMDGRRVFEERLGEGDQFQIGAHVFAVVAAGALAPVPRAHGASSAAHAPHDALSEYALAEVLHVGHRFVLRRARAIARDGGGQVLIKQLSGVEAHVYARDALAVRSRLARHIQQLRTLRHRHCVALLGGNADCDTPFLVESLAVGGALQRDLRATWRAEDVARVMLEIGRGLAFLHAHGVMHGALSPRDIVFDATGAALVANGGLAHVFAGSAAQGVAADLAYRAPELQRSGAASIAGDVFALGVIGYQLLVGRLPVPSGRGTPPLRGCGAALLDAIIWRALHRDPRKRWPDLDAMCDALTHYAAAPAETARADTQARPIRLLVPGAQRLIPVDASPFVLGRLNLNPADRELSRLHATLVFRDNAWHVEASPDAVNGVLLNRSACTAGRARMINPGDELLLGATTVRIVE